MQFGLFFFSSSDAVFDEDKYRLLIESAKYADQHDFSSVWIPERHFTKEGGLYPNPAVLQAALARETRQIALRAGSVVMPLNDPIRVAEEWAMVDNLSGGRVGISFASGWHPNDFVFFPEKYGDRHEEMYRGIALVQKLWRGESVSTRGGDGRQVEVRIYPVPRQSKLPTWITAAGSPQTFTRAGEIGAHLLTHLFNQSLEELAEKIKLYRRALAQHGHDSQAFRVTVAAPTFVWGTAEDAEMIHGEVHRAFTTYIKSASYLLKAFVQNRGRQIDVEKLSRQELEEYAQWVCERLISQKRVLFGTPETCFQTVAELKAIGVDELICQMDFGMSTELVLQNLPHLNRLRERCQSEALTEYELELSSTNPRAETNLTTAPTALKPFSSEAQTVEHSENLLRDIQARCQQEIASAEFYESLSRRGLHVDSDLRAITRLWRRDGEALGQVRLPESLAWEADSYHLHPALLDACFQLLLVTLRPDVVSPVRKPPSLPAGLRSFQVYGRPAQQVWSHALLRPTAADEETGELEGDIRILDEEGQVIIEALGLRLRHCDDEAWERAEPSCPVNAQASRPEGQHPENDGSARQVTDHNQASFIRGALLKAEPMEREQLLATYMCEEVAKVLELPVSKVDIHRAINNLGLDSLMAIQLKNRIEGELGVVVPIATFLRGASVAQLTEQLLPQLTTVHTTSTATVSTEEKVTEYPLSKGQQALWFMHQLTNEDASYNTIELAASIRGPIDVPTLRRAFQALVNRHPALRTIYQVRNGKPVQVVLDQQEAHFEERDASTYSAARLNEEMAEEYRRPFNLEEGSLLRVCLFTKSPEEHLLLLAAHHIAVDFLSLEIIMTELQAIYFAERAGVEAVLPPLRAQYTDYVRWQAEMLAGSEGKRLWSYWQRQLAGELPVLNLPTDRPRPHVPTLRGAIHHFKHDEALTRQLRSLAKAEGVTLYTILLAALAVLFYRYTGQQDILINSPTANRSRAEFEGIVGYFANPVIMRTTLSGNLTFRKLLTQVNRTVLGALDHQDYPLSLLVEQLQPTRDPGRTPLSDVVFSLDRPLKGGGIGTMIGQPNEGEMAMEPIIIEERVVRYDLVLVMIEGEESISAIWQYKTDLFDASTVARMADDYQSLLQGIVEQPELRLHKEELREESPRQELHARRLGTTRRNAIDLSRLNLVKMGYLSPGETFPLVIEPNMKRVNLVEWAKSNPELIEAKLLEHGAILFRGFPLASVSEFEQFALASCNELFGEYGDLPREEVSGKVYGSTPYPSEQAILPHNESSQLHCWPRKIWFYCAREAEQGGETPIVDCRKVYQLIAPEIRERLRRKGLMYVRNYTDGLDVSWQTFFRTADRSAVEDYCRRNGIDFEWKDNDRLRTRTLCPAVARHPKTGEMVFFNQIQAHHESCLEPAVRRSLLSLFAREELPRNVYYGDGSVIEDAVVAEIREVYQKASRCFPWEQGDILMLDNMLSAHGRNPYQGPRKIVVTMGEMVSLEEILSSDEPALENAVANY